MEENPGTRRSSWRCMFGWHRYHTVTNDSGERFLTCGRCGKEDYPPTSAGPRVVPG